ncbi:MAG TPA: hypothetical protein VF960_15805 [Chloroflexota bacterium]
MSRPIRASLAYPQPLPLDIPWPWRRSRSVLVTITGWGVEMDSFLSRDPALLLAAVKPIHRHLRDTSVALSFDGIEETSLPVGLLRRRRELPLADLTAALRFLES